MLRRTPPRSRLARLLVVLAGAALNVAIPATALLAQTAAGQTTAAQDSIGGAPVIYAGDTLFRLHATLGPFSPEDRASTVGSRIANAATRLASGADTIAIVEREAHTELLVGDVVLMSVLEGDAAAEGVERAVLARRNARAIVEAARLHAAEVSFRALLLGAAYAALATIVLVLLMRLIAASIPRVTTRLEALRERTGSIRIQQYELLSAQQIAALLLASVRVARIGLTLLLLYFYVPLVLSFFPWTRALSYRIAGYALTPFVVAWDTFVAYLPNLFYIAMVVIVTYYLLKLVHAVFRAIAGGAIKLANFDPEWAEPTYKVVRVLFFAFALVILYPYLPGAKSDAFKGVSLFLGLLFSLGSSSAVGNLVAGILLTYTRSFRIGDRVKIGDTIGDVTAKHLLVTRLRTIKNVEISVPNSSVIGGQVINYTALAASRGLILPTTVTIGYDVPWKQVQELLVEAARRTEHVLAEPAPFVLQTSLDDFYVSYELNVYTDRADIMAGIYSRLHANIQDAFNEGGVEIMSPHYGALRDGNQSTIPANYLAKDYVTPSFRLQATNGAGASSGDGGSSERGAKVKRDGTSARV